MMYLPSACKYGKGDHRTSTYKELLESAADLQGNNVFLVLSSN